MASEKNAIGGVDRLTLTVEEAASLLGISRGLAYKLASSGELPTIRLGRRLLVPIASLQLMLAQTKTSVD
ncbi:helix-turn-helix domain-containing protein [Chloroflexota bacterium]